MTSSAARALLGPAEDARLDKRRHARVKVALLGRFLLPDRTECPFQTIDMSPGGVAVFAPLRGDVGQRIVLYIDELGRLEGEIVRRIAGGFAVKFSVTPGKRDRLADQLTWLANRDELGLVEDRRYQRITPANPSATMTLSDGRKLQVSIIDVSLSGAMIASEVMPEVGELVLVGSTKGRIVRADGERFAMEFVRLLPSDAFDESIVL
ncbi:MAG: pilus assembly protein PilZ [Hyphomicrobiales bacterium]|nr:pilus assembly protein PilZ [Hyphomicrobiales bacterium]